MVAFLSAPAWDQQPPQSESASPAAPYQTVHAVLPHTAFRHRSSSGMHRRPSLDSSGESIDAEFGQPGIVEPAGPKTASGGVFDAGQLGQPQVHVAVDEGELPVRVSVAEVRSPTPKHGVEISDNVAQLTAGQVATGAVPDLGPDVRPWPGPTATSTGSGEFRTSTGSSGDGSPESRSRPCHLGG